MVLGSTAPNKLQRAVNTLTSWAQENSLEINEAKTVQMVFRKGGKIAGTDIMTLNGNPLEIVNKFRYLGITLQTTGTCFSTHTRQQAIAATKAIHEIAQLQKLSIQTAMILFNTKIVPIFTYGITLTWTDLTKNPFDI